MFLHQRSVVNIWNRGGIDAKTTTATKKPTPKKLLKKKDSSDMIVVDSGRFSAASPPSTTVSNSTDPLKDAMMSDMMRSIIQGWTLVGMTQYGMLVVFGFSHD